MNIKNVMGKEHFNCLKIIYKQYFSYIEYIRKVLSTDKTEESIKKFSNELTNFDFYYIF